MTAIGRFFSSRWLIPSEPVRQLQAWLQGELTRAKVQCQPLQGNDSDHNGKTNAGEEGAAKEAKNQVRHRDKSWSKGLVWEERDNASFLYIIICGLHGEGCHMGLKIQGLGD